MLTLCTSLAPKLGRQDETGHECGASYQQQCVSSWLEQGAKVVAVNVTEELQWAHRTFPKVGLIPAPTDSRDHNRGRALPYIHDLVQAAAVQAEREFCGVINSDIYLQELQVYWPQIEPLLQGGIVVMRRMEMSWPSKTPLGLYPFGFDVFFMDRRLGAVIPESPFAVGIPWWDFWLPLMGFLKGFDVHLVQAPVVFHLKHATRWDDAQFVEYGAQLVEYLEAEARQVQDHPVFGVRGQYLLDGLKLVREASSENIRSQQFASALSRYLQWFFDEGAGVKQVTLDPVSSSI